MGKHGYNHGDFGWNELACENPAKAVAFYTEVFSWQTEEMEMPGGTYTILINGEEKLGGICFKEPGTPAGPSAWMPYLTVDNVDERAAQVETLGGKIILPPQDIPVPNGPRFSIVQDPIGATIGIITYAEEPIPTN